jgi:hypothetical protein
VPPPYTIWRAGAGEARRRRLAPRVRNPSPNNHRSGKTTRTLTIGHYRSPRSFGTDMAAGFGESSQDQIVPQISHPAGT